MSAADALFWLWRISCCRDMKSKALMRRRGEPRLSPRTAPALRDSAALPSQEASPLEEPKRRDETPVEYSGFFEYFLKKS
jgi:hypothetical protein